MSSISGDNRYVKAVLPWASGYRKVHPHFAWAHAFVAKHSTADSLRVESTAFAQYLDPESAWLAEIDSETLARGKAWWSENNPCEEERLVSRFEGQAL